MADFRFPDLEKISTIRHHLGTLAAQQAVRNSTADDLVILQSLCSKEAGDTKELYNQFQKYHRAISRAAHNKYLAETLDHFYGLSKRLWFLVLPFLDFLPSAVKSHINLVVAIEARNDPSSMDTMRTHIEEF